MSATTETLYAATILAADGGGRTALHLCTTAKEAVALLKCRLNVDVLDYGGLTPLHHASDRGYLEVVEVLLAAGATVDAKSNAGSTPLHRACKHDNIEVVKALLAAGADINKFDRTGWTPLHYACARNHRRIAETLLMAGAEMNAVDHHRRTPFEVCKTDEMRALFARPPSVPPEDSLKGFLEDLKALIAKHE